MNAIVNEGGVRGEEEGRVERSLSGGRKHKRVTGCKDSSRGTGKSRFPSKSGQILN